MSRWAVRAVLSATVGRIAACRPRLRGPGDLSVRAAVQSVSTTFRSCASARARPSWRMTCRYDIREVDVAAFASGSRHCSATQRRIVAAMQACRRDQGDRRFRQRTWACSSGPGSMWTRGLFIRFLASRGMEIGEADHERSSASIQQRHGNSGQFRAGNGGRCFQSEKGALFSVQVSMFSWLDQWTISCSITGFSVFGAFWFVRFCSVLFR